MGDLLPEIGEPLKPPVRLRWTMHDHEEMLEAKRVLSLEEHGMLQVLHDLYCRRSGMLPDDAKFIAGQAGETPARWKRIRSELLRKGLLETDGKSLICTLKRDAVRDGIKRLEDGAKGGRASGAARRSRSRVAGFTVPTLGSDKFSVS